MYLNQVAQILDFSIEMSFLRIFTWNRWVEYLLYLSLSTSWDGLPELYRIYDTFLDQVENFDIVQNSLFKKMLDFTLQTVTTTVHLVENITH